MAVIKKSNNEIQLFLKNASVFIRDTTNHIFVEKLNKQIKKLKDINDNYHEEMRDAAIEFCDVDEKNRIVYDEKGNFLFNKENFKKYNTKVKEINKKLISFDCVITAEMIKNGKLEKDFTWFFNDFIQPD